MLLPYGKKRIKSLDVFVRDAMTNTPHTGTTAPSYQIQIALQCFQSGGAAYGDSLFNTSLPECVSGRTFNHYDVNQIVDDAMVGIYLTQAVTTADFTASNGECDISCIIEKLT
jgi:predicted thioredoxin/glutaredoxin